MRTRHTSHSLSAFPVYSAGFISSDVILLGGGGGASRSGIKNRLSLYKVGHDKLDLLNEFELGKDEDVPMSMAVNARTKQLVAGVNSSIDLLKKGLNENCRVFEVKDNLIAPVQTRQTIRSVNTEDYQKVTCFSRNFDLLAVGSTDNELSLLSFPSLTPMASPVAIPTGELFDATFSSDNLLIASSSNLFLFALPMSTPPSPTNLKHKGKAKEVGSTQLELVKTILPPRLPGQGVSHSTFRAIRFHPEDSNVLYALMNTTPPRGPSGRKIQRKAYLCKLSTITWEPIRSRKISDSNATCFDISENGKLLAYGTSDYTIGIVDAVTLAPLITILRAHDFPPTVVRFNPSASLLVSGSPDNSIRVVDIPEKFGGQSWSLILIFIAILAVLIAYYAQGYLQLSSHSLPA